MNKQSGFTIIELLIVLAIISILTSTIIPSYKRYTQRARFAEVIMATAPYKTAISLAIQEGYEPTELSLGTHGIPQEPKPTKNLASISINNGIITATATQRAGRYTYILTPDENGSRWEISGTCVEEDLCKQ